MMDVEKKKKMKKFENFSLDKKIQILRLTELCYDMKEADDARRNGVVYQKVNQSTVTCQRVTQGQML
jgi:hypothetical protein